MLKFHPIPASMKTYTDFKKIFLVRIFLIKIYFRIKFKILILDLMLLPNNRVPLEGLYSSSDFNEVDMRIYLPEKVIFTEAARPRRISL